MKLCRTLLAVLGFILPACAQPAWFAPDDSSNQILTNGLAAAKQANHRLLVMYDGSWCTLCTPLRTLAMSDPDLVTLGYSGYEPVRVQIDDLAGLTDFAAKSLHAKLDPANPLLVTVIDRDGTLLSALTAARLMDKGQLSAAKLKTQLSEWLLGPSAAEVYRTALAALPAGKTAWVEFRADWCGWCKKMEKFFGDSEAAAVLAKYYSVITIDTEKNPGASELAKKLGAPEGTDGGIPWFAAVDAKGKVLATSEGPEGNIGYPDTNVEVTHFLSIMKTTAKGITPAEVATIANTIQSIKAKDAAAAGSH